MLNTLITDGALSFGSDVTDVKIYSSAGRLIKTVASPGWTLNIAEFIPGSYIVTGFVKDQAVSVRILKK